MGKKQSVCRILSFEQFGFEPSACRSSKHFISFHFISFIWFEISLKERKRVFCVWRLWPCSRTVRGRACTRSICNGMLRGKCSGVHQDGTLSGCQENGGQVNLIRIVAYLLSFFAQFWWLFFQKYSSNGFLLNNHFLSTRGFFRIYYPIMYIFLRGVDVLRGLDSNDDRTVSETKKCLQRSGVASFHLGKYKEAKNSFAEAVKFDSTGIK